MQHSGPVQACNGIALVFITRSDIQYKGMLEFKNIFDKDIEDFHYLELFDGKRWPKSA
jgi:hypothetical protein